MSSQNLNIDIFFNSEYNDTLIYNLLMDYGNQYEHVINNINIFWPDKSMLVQYIGTLLISDRAQRQGFSQDFMDVLIKTYNQYSKHSLITHRSENNEFRF